MKTRRVGALFLALCLAASVPGNTLAARVGKDASSGELVERIELPTDMTGEELPEAPIDRSVALVPEEAGAEGSTLFSGTPSAPYTTWQNATVVQPDAPVEFMLDSYDSSYTNSQVWLAVTVPHNDQAIRMDFSRVPKLMYADVFSEETLRASGPSYRNALIEFGNFSGSASYSCKVAYAGVYYIMLRAYSSNYTFDNVNASVTFSLLDGDGNEDGAQGNNDVWSRATELTENVNSYFNINGSNDVDWFKITTTYPGQAIKIVLSNFDYTSKQISACLYSEAQLQANSGCLLDKYSSTDGSFNWKANEPGTYYLRLKTRYSTEFFTRSLKVRYELVEPDGYELNDTWQTAASVSQDGYEMPFTLNGENDEDWFWFETSEANEVVYFTISGFETDYSNELSFYAYDINEANGDLTRLHYAQRINRNSDGKRTVQFERPGRHYARIDLYGTTPIENTLTFKLEHKTVLIDNGEPNDTWQQATPIYENSPQAYNLPAATDVDWFRFTVSEPNQTVEFTFDVPAGGNIYAVLYNRNALEVSGNSASSMENFFDSYYKSGSGRIIKRWMLDGVGEYYLKIYPDGGYFFEADGAISYSLIPPDQNERNNGWKTAAQLNEGVAAMFTLPAGNDTDWFKFDVQEPDQTVEFTLTVPAGGSVWAALYSGSAFVADGDGASSLTSFFNSGYSGSGAGEKTMRWMLEDAETYYLRIYPYSGGIVDADYTLTYRLVEPDRNEWNNTWRTATTINEGVATVFTLPASNDNDYFKLTTTEPDQTAAIRLTIPEGGSVYMQLYAGADYALNGDNAYRREYFFSDNGSGSGVITRYYMLEEPGDYYLQLWSNSIFDADATITYSLIGHDANENNNTWKKATVLHAQTNTVFTLTAGNDSDWFKLDRVTPGDKITVYLGNLPKGSARIYNVIHYKTDADVEPGHSNYSYPSLDRNNVTSYSRTYTVPTDGEYYLQLYHSEATATCLNTPMTFRYSIARDNIDIQSVGVSSIGNASTTIYQGKTLGLYAVINPANASNQNVTWASSAPDVATVDANGVVTAVAPGTARITVTTEQGGFTATSTITVVPPVPVQGVSVTSNEVGDPGSQESAPKILSLNTAIQLSYRMDPEGATNQDVTWTVSDPAVLSVTNYGKVAAIGSGSAYVTATTVDGGHTANYYINVPDETSPIKRISLNMGAATVYMGEPGTQLAANIYPSNATNKQIIWSSDNPTVASVNQNGLVTARSIGYATIRVAAQENNSIQASCTVSVQPARTRVTGISFASATLELGLYGTSTLAPIVAPANATDKSVTWESNNKNIVSVSRGGVVSGLNIGTAIITATTVDGEKTASITVRVSSNAPLGDLNNDGAVDAADALLILRNSVGLMALSEAQRSVADVNGDHMIDAGDAILILRYDAGLIQEFPGKKK